jgi:hypothetical protein
MNDLKIIAACDAGPDAMVALGLPRPKTLTELVQTMWAAQGRLNSIDGSRLAARDRMELDYMTSATKLPDAFPKRQPHPFPSSSAART